MARLLSIPDPPTAVFAESDQMAFGALRTLQRMGLSAPEDVSVIGYDDHEAAELLNLTTIAQPVAHQGELLARQILDALSGRSEAPTRVVVPTRLIVRGTTGAVRVTRPRPPTSHPPAPRDRPEQHNRTPAR
jgi:DNA-binding LacI/PurR family transcriptional regulator